MVHLSLCHVRMCWMQAGQYLQCGRNVTSTSGPRHLQRGRERRGTQPGNPVTRVMTPMWSSLEGGLLPVRKLRPILNLLQGHRVRTPRRGLRMLRQGCRRWQSISEPIVRILVIQTPSAPVHGLWALVSPGPIKLFIHIHGHIYVWLCLFRWNEDTTLETMDQVVVV